MKLNSHNFTDDEIELGRKMFAGTCDFVAGVNELSQLPPLSLPEVAFAGRSNVGKSSLINAITGHNALARVSHTPGRTQQLNFFNLCNRLLLVDLPGYGYAKVSKDKVKAWTVLLKKYLSGRSTLCRACVLVDSRHGLKETDLEMMKMLDETAVSYVIILTKIDDVKASELELTKEKLVKELAKRPAAYPVPFETSSVSGRGIPELRAYLQGLAKPL